MQKAVFLDRDGTIIFDAHYLSDPKLVKLLPDAARALAMLGHAGFLLFLFTNQSGVGRGLFSIEAVHRCNERMMELLGLGDSIFLETCIATESPDQPSLYRKPSPLFINESIARHDIDRSQAWMVGDKPSDVEAGLNAQVKTTLIGRTPATILPGVMYYESLYDFAKSITTAGS